MKVVSTLLLILFVGSNQTLLSQTPRNLSASEISLEIQKMRNGAKVLYIAAHPDDENTRLLSWLVNHQHVQAAYLSLTRGDGGQNLIGPEQGTELGIIRSQELIAARRTDGATQFFTRAFDFGYSKTPEETFEKWGRENILADMVFIIRYYRPDIIITRFATDGSGGHGHHTASAMLAEEAFDAAADPKRFPEQISQRSVKAWQCKRLLYNSAARFWNPNADMSGHIKVDVGSYNELLGKSYGEIAAESRSMHRSQGFGSAKQRGEQFEYFKPIKGDTAKLTDIFMGIDQSLNRYDMGEKLDALFAKLEQAWQNQNLKECNALLAQLNEPVMIKRPNLPFKYFERLSQLALHMNGIHLEALAENTPYSAISDSIKIKLIAINRRSANVKLIGWELNSQTNGSYDAVANEEILLEPNKLWQKSLGLTIKENEEVSTLYWLNQPIQNNLFQHTVSTLPWALSNNFSIEFTLMVEGLFLKISKPLQYKWVDPDKGEIYRPHIIVHPISISPLNDVLVFSKEEKSKLLQVNLTAQIANCKGQLWAGKTPYPFTMTKKGEVNTLTLTIKPEMVNQGKLKLFAMVAGYKDTFSLGIKEIKYDHIPTQTLMPSAAIKVSTANLLVGKRSIGYIPGAGDEIAECLEMIGYKVTLLTDEFIKSGNLNLYPTIILGVRAFNTNDLLSTYRNRLMEYVKAGGNLIVQYNTNSFAGPFKGEIGPYPFKISRDRITKEEANVTFLQPKHILLQKPNLITQEDFSNWVQERSIYQATEFDTAYTPLFEMNDPGEKPTKGSIITCNYGKGHFTYTGLVFFRQLPAGNTGAYKLLVNLIEYE